MTKTLATWTEADVEQFVRWHLAGAVWTSEEELREELKVGSLTPGGTGIGQVEDLLALVHPDMAAQLEREARAFAEANRADLERWFAPDHAGYDLWMTRTHQGCGYWDRYLPNDPADIFSDYALSVRTDKTQVAAFDEAKLRLRDEAQKLSEPSVYAGDDGKIYV